MTTIRNAVFTCNNWSEDHIEKLKALPHVRYCCFGKEFAPTTGTPHLQGYIQFSTKVRLNSLKKKLKGFWVEMAHGNLESNQVYTKKGDNFIEWGKPKVQGKRTDLEKVYNHIREKGSMKKLLNDLNPNLQQIRVAEKHLQYCEDMIDWKPDVTYITGKSGTGKSTLARQLAGAEYYRKCSSDKWFDGYDNQEVIILDDFRDSWMSLSDLLNLLDYGSRRIEYKGGSRWCRAKHIIITSIIPPDCIYRFTGEERHQIDRRITKTILLDKVYAAKTSYT